MNEIQPLPPRLARIALTPFLRAADVDSVPGDLLEEYREVKVPTLGVNGANVWYLRQVLSLAWHALWPALLGMAALRLVASLIPPDVLRIPSLVQVPGVSVVDAGLFVVIGFHGARRGGRIGSGIAMCAVVGFAGFALFLVYGVVQTPDLFVVPFQKPFVFAILAIAFAIAETFAMVTGAFGAAIGRRRRPTELRLS